MNYIFSLENHYLFDAGCSLRRIWQLSLKERIKIALLALENCTEHLTDKTPEPDSIMALDNEGAFIAEFSDHLPLFERLYLEYILQVGVSGMTEALMLDELAKNDYPNFFLSDIESAFYYHRELGCDRMRNTLERMLMLELNKNKED